MKEVVLFEWHFFFDYPLAITALKLSRYTSFMTLTQTDGSDDTRQLLCFKFSFQH